MTSIDVVVVLLGAALIAGLAWFFFRPRQAATTRVEGGVQTVDVRVKGGYAPNLIRATVGMPLRLRFDRQENSDCTARVVFPDFRLSTSLLPFRTTTVKLTPTEPGQYGFACGMNMLHGTLIVEPAAARAADARDGKDLRAREERAPDHDSDDNEATAGSVATALRDATGDHVADHDAPTSEEAEDAARRDEVRDLRWRVGLGALLSAPVLYATMVADFISDDYVPAVLTSSWALLVLSAP